MKKRNSNFTIPLIMMGLLLLIACGNKVGEANHNSQETDSFTDVRDGKTYKTVKVGDQWIMAENLAYKPDSGKYWAYEDADSNIATYGYLYDWKTAMNIVPDGWHLPSREEWNTLRKTLGGKRGTWYYYEKIYPKMIKGGSSGLDMMFGGMRSCSGNYKHLDNKAIFWSSTTLQTGISIFGLDKNKEGYPHGLRFSKAPSAYNNGYQKSCPGYSVRLFKD